MIAIPSFYADPPHFIKCSLLFFLILYFYVDPIPSFFTFSILILFFCGIFRVLCFLMIFTLFTSPPMMSTPLLCWPLPFVVILTVFNDFFAFYLPDQRRSGFYIQLDIFCASHRVGQFFHAKLNSGYFVRVCSFFCSAHHLLKPLETPLLPPIHIPFWNPSKTHQNIKTINHLATPS